MKKITLCISCVLLSGCFGDNDVQTLKKVVFPEVDSNVAVGVALDKRDVCKATSWNIQKKDKNVIDYTCELSDYSAMFDSFRAQLIKKETKDLTKRIADLKNATETIDKSIEHLGKIKKAIDELTSSKLFEKYVEGAAALNITPDYRFISDEGKSYVYRHNRKKDLQNDYIQTQKDIKEVITKFEVDPIFVALIFTSINDKLGHKDKEIEVANYLEGVHKELKGKQNDNLDLIKDLNLKITGIETEITKSHLAIQPKKIVQVVNFSKSKDNFSLQDCVFKLTLNDDKEVTLTSEHCFPMSYDKTYTDDYKKLFGHYYGTNITRPKSEVPKQPTALPSKPITPTGV